MQVIGELPHTTYERLSNAGWEWDAHEEDWDEFPEGTMVLLLERDGWSRFMLEAVPYAPEIGVRIWGPGDEDRAALADEILQELELIGEPLVRESSWPDEE
jgi:hypothetical protein